MPLNREREREHANAYARKQLDKIPEGASVVYVDGSLKQETGRMGIGIVCPSTGVEGMEEVFGFSSINEVEEQAILRAVELFSHLEDLHIVTDSITAIRKLRVSGFDAATLIHITGGSSIVPHHARANLLARKARGAEDGCR